MEVLVSKAIDKDGAALWPERFPLSMLEDKRQKAGSVIFNMQYQNDVELAKGRIFRPEWIRYYTALTASGVTIQAIDPAISSRDTADYFAAVTIRAQMFQGKLCFFVLRAFRERGLSFEAQIIYIIQNSVGVTQTIIEKVAYQDALVQAVRSKGVAVRTLTPLRDKVARAYTVTPYFENGQVYFLRSTTQSLLIDELLLFPDAEHDDLFDAMTMALTGLSLLHRRSAGIPSQGTDRADKQFSTVFSGVNDQQW